MNKEQHRLLQNCENTLQAANEHIANLEEKLARAMKLLEGVRSAQHVRNLIYWQDEVIKFLGPAPQEEEEQQPEET